MDIIFNNLLTIFDNFQSIYKLKYGSYAIQGHRDHMEDTTRVVQIKLSHINMCYLVILCDGHAGDACSKYVSKQLPILMEFHLKHISSTTSYENINNIITKCILRLDSIYKQKIDFSGTTCVFALFINDHLFIVNIGDSRCIIGNSKNKLKLATKDHKPNEKKELARIHKNGGSITNIDTHRVFINEEVNGLAISRVIGDNHYKGYNIVISNPDIYYRKILRSDEIMILASDGLWEVITNSEAIEFVNARINKLGLSTIAKELVDFAFKKGSMDNITVIIVMI